MTKNDSTETKTEYKEDAIDQLTRRTSQLSAMLIMITGCGFKSFDSYNDTIKENYLWACADHANELEVLANKMAG
jgi:hypothetical protein